MSANLTQVLQALDQLGPQEIAVVGERLAVRQNTALPVNGQSSDLFALSFSDYLALSDEAREAISLRAYRSLGIWINAELVRRKAQWILVCGGQVVESSSTLRDYPSDEKLMQIGQEWGHVPFVFVDTPQIEESPWSVLENDFYRRRR